MTPAQSAGIVLVNQSKLITDVDVRDIADACDRQLGNEVATAWSIKDPLRVTTAKVGATKKSGSYPFFLVDEIPEAPGALAYHFVQESGVPAGKIGVKTTLDARESVWSRRATKRSSCSATSSARRGRTATGLRASSRPRRAIPSRPTRTPSRARETLRSR